VATRKKQGKPAELTTIEVLKKTSDTLETKVQTEVNKQGKLQKTTIKRSTKEVVDIVATIVSGIPTKAERTEYINEVIADLKKLIDKVEPITEKMAKGGMTKDFSGNYYSTNDFVGSNGLKDLANEVFGKGWKAEDDVDQIAELANHSGLKYVVIYAENRSEWNKYRQIDTAHPTSDSNYDIFVIANEDWKKYVNDSEGDSDYDDEEFAKGGDVNYRKNWEVTYITMQGTKGTKKITLGRMSDKDDVKNQLKRMDLNIREVTSIKEIGMMARGGMIDESTKNQIYKGFTKKSFNEILNELFPYNFGFKVFKPLNRQNILTPNYDDAPSSLYGYDDSQIKSKLHFDQYKRDHAINFAIEQGGENTYYYFLLGDEEGNEYVGTFGFKDQGDVDSSYVTRFIAFLMECYGLPFEVKHSVN
jgi:hypothetical protein